MPPPWPNRKYRDEEQPTFPDDWRSKIEPSPALMIRDLNVAGIVPQWPRCLPHDFLKRRLYRCRATAETDRAVPGPRVLSGFRYMAFPTPSVAPAAGAAFRWPERNVRRR